MAVRCVFAHPGGLEIDVVVRAVGVLAEAATRQSDGIYHPSSASTTSSGDTWPGSEPVLLVEINGRRATAHAQGQTTSSGEDDFSSELRIAVPDLPSDGSITLTAAWPQAGLAEGSVTLPLEPLDDLHARVVRLP
jgi:hypothetical protein